MVRGLAERLRGRRRDHGQPRCSFCGKDRERVQKLIAGPGVCICDECVELCNEIIRESQGRA